MGIDPDLLCYRNFTLLLSDLYLARPQLPSNNPVPDLSFPFSHLSPLGAPGFRDPVMRLSRSKRFAETLTYANRACLEMLAALAVYRAH